MADITDDKLYLLPYVPERRGGNKEHVGSKRDNAEREHDLYLIAGMYLRKKTGREILKAVNERYKAEGKDMTLGINMIYGDIEEIHKRWVNSALIDFNEAKGRELEEWDRQEARYLDAYERSIVDFESNEEQTITDEIAFALDQVVPITRTKTRHKTERRNALIAALNGVDHCIEMRCKILGLFSPDKIQVDWRVEAQRAGLPENTASQMFDELVEKYVEAMEKNAEGDAEGETEEPDTG